MSFLLDTHTFLWWVTDADRLSKRARETIADGDAAISLSVVSVWEMAIKRSLGKLTLPTAAGAFVSDQIAKNRFGLLPISLRHAARVETLPHLHGDPFDRLLVAQSLEENLTLVTVDGRLSDYGVPTLW